MASSYPYSYDNIPQIVDKVTEVKAVVVNFLIDAINALEAELGLDPSATYGTVRARLDAMEALMSGIGKIEVELNGTPILNADALNFTGNVTVTQNGSKVDIDILGSSGSQDLEDVLDNGNTTGPHNILISPGYSLSTTNASGNILDLTTGINGVTPGIIHIHPGAPGLNTGSSPIVIGNGSLLSLPNTNGNGTGSGGPIALIAGDGGATNGAGGQLILYAGAGGGTTGSGGNVEIKTFSGGSGNSNAGKITLIGGDGNANGIGGNVEITGGKGGATGAGGNVLIITKNGSQLNAGNINLTTGSGATDPGVINIITNPGATKAGNIQIAANGSANTTDDGDIFIAAAANFDGDGGNIELGAGAGASSGNGGNISIFSAAPGGIIQAVAGDNHTNDTDKSSIFLTSGSGISDIDPMSGGNIILTSGNGNATTGSFGGNVSLISGNGDIAGNVQLNAGNSLGTLAGNVFIIAGNGNVSSVNGGSISLKSGNSGTNANSGQINIETGNVTGGSGVAGSINIEIGTSVSSNGGSINLAAGDGSGSGPTVYGGDINLTAGDGDGNSDGGNIVFNPGSGAGAGVDGAVIVNGKLTVTGLIDPTGLVLVHQGSAPYTPSVIDGVIWTNSSDGHLMYTNDSSTVDLSAAGGGAGSLSDTLAIGNTTGANNIIVNSGQSILGATSGTGGTLTLSGGVATTTNGGNVNVLGTSAIDGTGGNIDISAGHGVGTAKAGGEIKLISGDGDSGGAGGIITLEVGESDSVAGANIILKPGVGSTPGIVDITGTARSTGWEMDGVGSAPLTPSSGDGILWVDSSNSHLKFTDNTTTIDLSVSPSISDLEAVLTEGNITGANDIIVVNGQKIAGETDTNGGVLWLVGGAPTTGIGGGVEINGSDAVAGTGGNVVLTGGAGEGSSLGGVISIASGEGGASGNAGGISISTGQSYGAAPVQNINLFTGESANSSGNINLYTSSPSNTSNQNAGYIWLGNQHQKFASGPQSAGNGTNGMGSSIILIGGYSSPIGGNNSSGGGIVLEGGNANPSATNGKGGDFDIKSGAGKGGGRTGYINIINGAFPLRDPSSIKLSTANGSQASNVEILAGNMDDSTSSATSGNIDIKSGESLGDSDGGYLYLKAGDQNKNTTNSFYGGKLSLLAGDAPDGFAGGDVEIIAGAGGENGGSISITPGIGNTVNGEININGKTNANGDLVVSGTVSTIELRLPEQSSIPVDEVDIGQIMLHNSGFIISKLDSPKSFTMNGSFDFDTNSTSPVNVYTVTLPSNSVSQCSMTAFAYDASNKANNGGVFAYSFITMVDGSGTVTANGLGSGEGDGVAWENGTVSGFLPATAGASFGTNTATLTLAANGSTSAKWRCEVSYIVRLD